MTSKYHRKQLKAPAMATTLHGVLVDHGGDVLAERDAETDMVPCEAIVPDDGLGFPPAIAAATAAIRQSWSIHERMSRAAWYYLAVFECKAVSR